MSSKSTSKKSKPTVLNTTLGKAPVGEEDVDISVVWKPIDTSIFGLREVLDLFTTATNEVKRYIIQECDLLYECRICRSIFRSLANFILHKRKYCRDKFEPLCNENGRSNCQEKRSTVSDVRDLSPRKVSKKQDLVPEQTTEWLSGKKTIASVLQKLLEKKNDQKEVEELANQDISEEPEKEPPEEKNDVVLEPIASNNSGVFQTMFKNLAEEQGKRDYMKTEVMELHGVFSSDEAVIGSDGKVCNFTTEKQNMRVGIPKNTLICTICNQKFSTKKTLMYHVKYKHNNTRMIYPCPICKEEMANAWGVFRHLVKIHRKTTSQIRKMRDQIHASAFRRDMQSTQPESSVRSSRRGTLNDSENQWMEDIEADNDLQMCSGCGRRFERRAALHSHSQLCTKRIALCNTIKENNSKQVQEEKQDKGNKQTKVVKNNEKDSLKGAVRRKPLIIRKKVGNLKTNLEKKQSEDVDSGFSENVEKADLKKPDNTKSDEIKASDIQSDANIDIKGDSEISTPENKDKLKANVYFSSMNRDDVLDIIGVTNSKETENSPVKDENKIIDTPASVEVPKSLRNDISESKKTEVVVAAGISQQDKKMLTNEDHIYCIPDNTDFKKRTTLEIQKINLELKNTIKEIMSVYENDNILNSHENIFSDRIENVELKRKRLLDDVNSDTCPKKLNQQVVQTSASDEITVCQTKQILVNCGSSGSEETQNSPNPKNKEAALDIPENSESVGKSCQPNSDIITDVAQSLDENVTSNQKQETDLVKFPQSPQVMEVEVSTDVTNSEKSPEKIQEDNSETKYSQAVVNCKPCQLEEFEDTKTSKDMEAASVTDPGLRKMVMEVIFGGEINLPVMQVHITQESAASDAPTSAPVPSKAPAPTPVTRPVRTVRRTLLPDEFCYNFTKCNNKSTKDDVELSRFGQRPLKVYSGKVKKTHNNK